MSENFEPEMPPESGVYSVTTLFSSSTPEMYNLFMRLADMAAQLGNVEMVAHRTHVEFIAARPFALVEAEYDTMPVTFIFTSRDDNPHFQRIESTEKGEWLHTVNVDDEGDFDKEFVGWLEKAYSQAS